ncbi:MAG TPA: OmpA family protein, partial [Nitrospira sp.]|nr:OmpA family protein [Nitrospira sp.]
HNWPNFNQIPPQAPAGTDRVMIGTGVTPVHMHLERRTGTIDRVMIDSETKTTGGDGYSGDLEACYALAGLPDNVVDITKNPIQLAPSVDDRVLWANTQFVVDCTRERTLTMPAPIVLDVGELPSKIDNVVVQIFVDDFQAALFHSYFQVSLNGTRIPTFEDVINSLDQTGPIGKLVSMRLLPEYWPLLKSGTVNLLIDDPTTHVRDGYAVDFVRILVNPHKFKYQVSLTATVTDADTHKPITGATVSVGNTSLITDAQGKCELKAIPAGLVVATANAPGYDQNSVPVDLPAGQSGHADIQLHPHQENTAALEKSIAQTGTAAVYGIHFDTGSAKLRADSMPALNAVLGLIDGRPGSKWIIAGHTDNQGSDALNIPLSKARATSVISWLTSQGIASDRLEPQGFGATRPVADNATASGRALNRRVEVSLGK